MKTNIVIYLIQNKRRIAKALYFLAALIEQLPEPPCSEITKATDPRSNSTRAEDAWQL
jgi:hypothetical protein